MRIGFDARMIGHPGIGRYIRNLLNGLLSTEEAIEFVLYGDPARLKEYSGAERCAIREYAAPIYSVKELLSNPFAGEGFDIVHIPHFNVPFTRIDNLVVTIHDLIYLKFPGTQRTLLKGMAAHVAFDNTIKKAKRIIAVSENTKKDIIEKSPAAEGKIDVIYEAADPLFRPVDDEAGKKQVRDKYNLPEEIILCVGSLRMHKNIERLIDCCARLRARGLGHKLVLVGREDPKEASIIKKVKTSDCIYLGEVGAEELVLIYNLAGLLVMPSLYEGFGLPPLEAMACATPVAASSAASLPEVVGDAGVLFDPYDVKDMEEKICSVLHNEELRKNLINKGMKRAEHFSWQKTAFQTKTLWAQCL
ncbi:MAG: glycosyltransferase family 4 protein [Candidatus Omnitrophica bacterium]|nr:glycosyltransferase family 4 protein [Candidatus Omnitrophota bacterium]